MQRKHKTGFSQTDDAVNKIIRRKHCCTRLSDLDCSPCFPVTVQTGLITALCAIVDLILFLASVSQLAIYGSLVYRLTDRVVSSHLDFTSSSTSRYQNSTLTR